MTKELLWLSLVGVKNAEKTEKRHIIRDILADFFKFSKIFVFMLV